MLGFDPERFVGGGRGAAAREERSKSETYLVVHCRFQMADCRL
jgi:hypothetical protein